MRSQTEFVQLLDRYQLGQAQRLCAGLFVDADFRHAHGCLLLAVGRGKWLKPQWVEQRVVPIPNSIGEACRNLTAQPNMEADEFFQLRLDLTRTLAGVAETIIALSGNASKKLMTVCVDDPGIWLVDYDGKRSFESFCEASHLAELCGITVVDSLPQRDLACGGRGSPIEPLADWLLFSDRNPRVAKHPRLMVNLDHELKITYLPESDGLDEELPRIQYRQAYGLKLEAWVRETFGFASEPPDDDLSQVGAQGKVITELARSWSDSQKQASDGGSREICARARTHSLEILRRGQHSFADGIRTVYWHMAQQIKEFAKQCGATGRQVQVIGGGKFADRALLINEVDRAIGKREHLSFEQIGLQLHCVSAATAAVLGLMHIDQMPANLPWLSGCEFPRVLGRLTPGRPANWRQVIMEMADYHPPLMKLRDAV